MRRREFIAGLGSAAAAWPAVARAQQPDRMRRIGVLMGGGENDPEGKTYLSAFTQGLAALGWTDGRNLRMDVRSAAADIDRARMFAKELEEEHGKLLAEAIAHLGHAFLEKGGAIEGSADTTH
jgi:putative ABC transport system substrate-binding protein